MQKILLAIIGLAIIAFGVWYFFFFDKEAVDTEDAVAIVNGEEISRAEFESFQSQITVQQGVDMESLDAETKSQFKTQIMDELIAQTLLEQKVNESKITVEQEKVDAQIDAIINQFDGEEAFQEALVAEGISEEELRSQKARELATQKYLEEKLNFSSISATDQEIQELYDQEAAQNETIPALEQVRDQVENLVIQQKQQALFIEFIQQLRAEADIEILI